MDGAMVTMRNNYLAIKTLILNRGEGEKCFLGEKTIPSQTLLSLNNLYALQILHNITIASLAKITNNPAIKTYLV
jgi:hypothetical protein